jgi:hypothetical protein
MSHEKNLSDYALELVGQYASYDGEDYDLSLDDLPCDEQNELARLLIESTDREINECVYGDDFNIDNKYTCAVLNMLKNDCEDTNEELAQVIRNNILIYYKKSLNKILLEACDDFLYLRSEDTNHAPEYSDIVWSKF